MALTAVSSGTTASLTLATPTNLEAARAPGAATTYVYEIDASALASGETFFVRIYTVVLASGTENLAYIGSYIGGSDADPIIYSVPIPVDTGTGITIRCSVEQKNGTGRAFPWKLFSL